MIRSGSIFLIYRDQQQCCRDLIESRPKRCLGQLVKSRLKTQNLATVLMDDAQYLLVTTDAQPTIKNELPLIRTIVVVPNHFLYFLSV